MLQQLELCMLFYLVLLYSYIYIHKRTIINESTTIIGTSTNHDVFSICFSILFILFYYYLRLYQSQSMC